MEQDLQRTSESGQDVDVAPFGTLTAAPLHPEGGWRALGPTQEASTLIFHRLSSQGDSGDDLVPGFHPHTPLIVEFPNLASGTQECPVSVDVVGASNPFFALLVAKKTLAQHLGIAYMAEHDVLLCQGGAVSMGKLDAIDIGALRDMPIEVALQRGAEDSPTLYHVM
jgi:hypothetical protein